MRGAARVRTRAPAAAARVDEAACSARALRRERCAGYSGKKFIFDKAKELGVRIVVVDGPDSWAKSMVRSCRRALGRALGLRRRSGAPGHAARYPRTAARQHAQAGVGGGGARSAAPPLRRRTLRPLLALRALYSLGAQVTDGIAEKFIAVDMRDADTVFDRTLAEIKARALSLRSRRSVR